MPLPSNTNNPHYGYWDEDEFVSDGAWRQGGSVEFPITSEYEKDVEAAMAIHEGMSMGEAIEKFNLSALDVIRIHNANKECNELRKRKKKNVYVDLTKPSWFYEEYVDPPIVELVFGKRKPGDWMDLFGFHVNEKKSARLEDL